MIVDDLVQTGGTLLECAAALLSAGASKVSAYVSHAVFPHESWRKFLHHDDDAATAPASPVAARVRFEKFWVASTIPGTAAALRGRAPFEVLSIVDILNDILGVGVSN